MACITDFAVQRIKAELLPRYPNVDDVLALDHGYGCGVAANPAVGFCTDLLVRAGARDPLHNSLRSVVARARAVCGVVFLANSQAIGCKKTPCGPSRSAYHSSARVMQRVPSVMFSETTEVRDGIDQLTARASTPEVAEAMIREMAWYDAYLQRGSADRSANTTPGNKAGGLSNIVEKAIGSIVKSGSMAITGVLAPGEKLRQKGLTYAATPASDFICGTLQLAAGMNLHVFTTGRGTPYGLAAVPVIKVATRSDLARRWHDLMDVNAGRIADGTASIEDVGWELFWLMLDVASGRKKTWAEH